MSLQRTAARRDDNEPEIINLFERLGFTVHQISSKGVPDLLIGGDYPILCPRCDLELWHKGNLLVEVKNGPSAGLTDDQIKFHKRWLGQIAIAHTLEEALKIVGRAA